MLHVVTRSRTDRSIGYHAFRCSMKQARALTRRALTSELVEAQHIVLERDGVVLARWDRATGWEKFDA